MNKYDFDWDAEKNSLLKETRDVCFEDVIFALESGAWSIDEPHPNQEKFSHQYQIVVFINNYAYVAPYVVNQERKTRFLKTVYPSRKHTKLYLSSQ